MGATKDLLSFSCFNHVVQCRSVSPQHPFNLGWLYRTTAWRPYTVTLTPWPPDLCDWQEPAPIASELRSLPERAELHAGAHANKPGAQEAHTAARSVATPLLTAPLDPPRGQQ